MPEIEIENRKLNIFKRFWYSLNPNRYKELSNQGLKRAIVYFIIVISIMSICFTTITIYILNKYISSGFFQLEENKEILDSYVNAKILLKNENQLQINTYYDFSYFFTGYFINLLFTNFIYLILISAVGWLLAKSLKIKEKLKFKDIFSMSIYALTLPAIIYIIGSVVALFVAMPAEIINSLYIISMYVYLFIALFLIRTKENKENKTNDKK